MYDIAIIGAGPGGYQAAIKASQLGANVVLIEKEKLGGTCSNIGCIPTKALYGSAKFLDELLKSEDFGVKIGDINFYFKKAVERKNKVVEELRSAIKSLLKGRKIRVISGFGKIEEGNKENGFKLSITTDSGEVEFIKTFRVIIGTGSKPSLIPAFNIDHENILTSDDVLKPDFTSLPKSLIIIGAGVIGVEFANIFSSFGVKVTILEYLPTIIATEEKTVIKTLRRKLEEKGVNILTNQNVLKVQSGKNGIEVTFCDALIPENEKDESQIDTILAEKCLISIGRSQNSSHLGLEGLGVEIKRGAIPVNQETMETSEKGIYAIGDVNNTGMMFAHVASYEGFIAVANSLSDLNNFNITPKYTDYSSIPYTIFTNPEIGSVGFREKDAKLHVKNLNSKVYSGNFRYSSIGKAKCMNTEEGFLKILVDKNTDKILGASCIGSEAPEIIAEITLAMQYGITAKQLGSTVHSHPTISEIVMEAAEDVHGLAIHKIGRIR